MSHAREVERVCNIGYGSVAFRQNLLGQIYFLIDYIHRWRNAELLFKASEKLRAACPYQLTYIIYFKMHVKHSVNMSFPQFGN